MSVFDLYKAVTSKLIEIEDSKRVTCNVDDFLELLRQIDYVFEMSVTDNYATDLLFKKSSLAKSFGLVSL